MKHFMLNVLRFEAESKMFNIKLHKCSNEMKTHILQREFNH